MGFGDIGIGEVALLIAGGVVGCVSLRRNPPKVRVEVRREAMGSPLPTYTEEDARAGSPLGKGKDDRHGTPQNEVVSGKVMEGTIQMLESAKACACFQNALGFGSFPLF